MEINVTKHAVKRYRERLFDYTSSKQKISSLLIEIACKGQKVYSRPSTQGSCFEIKYRGISIVLVKNQTDAVIITCLGDDSYRKWVKHQDDNMKIAGRVLYLGQVG